MQDSNYARQIQPITLTSSPGAQVARAECAQCSGHDDWRVSRLPPPDIVRKHFTKRGWSLNRRSICPECAAKKKEKPMATVTSIKPVAPTADAKAARREAHDRIAVYFDLATGRYTDGYSDQRIAEETGVAVAWVKSRREEEFGSLKEPQEIRELRDLITSLTKQALGIAEEVKGATDRLNTYCKANGFMS